MLKKIFFIILFMNLLWSCSGDSSSKNQTFKVNFSTTPTEVSNKSLTIFSYQFIQDSEFNIKVSVLNSPQLGSIEFNDKENQLSYKPQGALGYDTFTILFSSDEMSIEQTFSFTVTDLSPHLAFSDLISGPSNGLGDLKGSGVIVTIWGYKLGSQQGDSILEFCIENFCLPAAHVYYWKNADGKLPGGPANLYESHGMQEIAFSIPESRLGPGIIKISNKFGVSTLPFTIREGDIFHIKQTGNDESGDGSYGKPWRTIARADIAGKGAGSGSTLYIHGVHTGDENTSQVIYNNNIDAMSSLEAQFSYVAYPNFQPEVVGQRGFSVYAGDLDITEGFIISKLKVYAAEEDEDIDGQPVNPNGRITTSYGIHATKNGRAVGNFISDAHPNDLTGACPNGEHAAITGSAIRTDNISNFKMFGNHIKDYGCKGTSRFHHTTYFTIRSADRNLQLTAPEIGWNFLQDNLAASGIHYFDENHSGENCGQFVTTFKIHNNVIINQAGAGLYYGAACPVNTEFDYFNNIVINSGLFADYNDEDINYNINMAVGVSAPHIRATSTLNYSNNLFYNWNAEGRSTNSNSCLNLHSQFDNIEINWNSNICYSDYNSNFIQSSYLGDLIKERINGSNNLWFIGQEGRAAPLWDLNPYITSPQLTIENTKVKIDLESPLLMNANTSLHRDVYGNLRKQKSTIGPVEY